MGIRQTLKKWSAYQQTVRELAALDNRQLNDLGISRTDIQKIAREHARALEGSRALSADDFGKSNARFLLR